MHQSSDKAGRTAFSTSLPDFQLFFAASLVALLEDRELSLMISSMSLSSSSKGSTSPPVLSWQTSQWDPQTARCHWTTTPTYTNRTKRMPKISGTWMLLRPRHLNRWRPTIASMLAGPALGYSKWANTLLNPNWVYLGMVFITHNLTPNGKTSLGLHMFLYQDDCPITIETE